MESNKLIAEFMGASIDDEENVRFVLPADGKGLAGTSLYSCRYHTSWDWLMPVVEKIDALSDFTLVKIERNTCQIMHAKAPYIYIAAENKIIATYDAVIQFIEWYNQQPNH